MKKYLNIKKILKKDLYRIILPFMITKVMPPFRSYIWRKQYHYHRREWRWKSRLIRKIPFKSIRRYFFKKLSAK